MYKCIQNIYTKYNDSVEFNSSNKGVIELEFRVKHDFKYEVSAIKKIINDNSAGTTKFEPKITIEKTINCIKNKSIYQIIFIGDIFG